MTKSHDLTGVIFQRLIADRKFLATFYTRPAAAALLAGLAIPADRAPGGAEWGDEDTIASLQIGDFACGTGTLLSAAYQRISLLHELNGGDPRKLHAPMMKHGLVGLDVLNIAVHLTAATLAGAHPDVPFDGECLLTMPYGSSSAGGGGGGGKYWIVGAACRSRSIPHDQSSRGDYRRWAPPKGPPGSDDSRRPWSVRPRDHESAIHATHEPRRRPQRCSRPIICGI